jgi:hypothetical protein
VGREEATVRLELWQGVAAIQPPTQMRGRGKGRGACGVLRRENGDGRGKKGRRRRATPLFKPRVGGVGEREGRGESVVRHDMWRRGWGGGPTGGQCLGRQRLGRDTRGWRGAVRTGERRGPLMCGPWPTVGGRGRGEKRGAWASPGKKGNGPSPKEQEEF